MLLVKSLLPYSIGEFIKIKTYLNRDTPLNVYDNALILEVRKNGDRQNG